MFLFAFLVGFNLIGLGVIAVCLCNAVDGYEDEAGFHVDKDTQQNEPD